MKENISSNSNNHESESDDTFLDKNYYNIEYPGQNLSRNESFKKWYSFQSEKIKIENEFRTEIKQNIKYNEFLVEEDIVAKASSFLFISLCKNCQCYSVHSLSENTIKHLIEGLQEIQNYFGPDFGLTEPDPDSGELIFQ
jgi:hypothetical protein